MIQDTDQVILSGPHFWELCAEQAVEAAKKRIDSFLDIEAWGVDVPAIIYIVIYVYNADACSQIPYKSTLSVNMETFSNDLSDFRDTAYHEFERLNATKIKITGW